VVQVLVVEDPGPCVSVVELKLRELHEHDQVGQPVHVPERETPVVEGILHDAQRPFETAGAPWGVSVLEVLLDGLSDFGSPHVEPVQVRALVVGQAPEESVLFEARQSELEPLPRPPAGERLLVDALAERRLPETCLSHVLPCLHGEVSRAAEDGHVRPMLLDRPEQVCGPVANDIQGPPVKLGEEVQPGRRVSTPERSSAIRQPTGHVHEGLGLLPQREPVCARGGQTLTRRPFALALRTRSVNASEGLSRELDLKEVALGRIALTPRRHTAPPLVLATTPVSAVSPNPTARVDLVPSPEAADLLDVVMAERVKDIVLERDQLLLHRSTSPPSLCRWPCVTGSAQGWLRHWSRRQ
jgi:hypothetical protein